MTASEQPPTFEVIVEPGLPLGVVKLATAVFTGGIVGGTGVEVDFLELRFQSETDGHVVISVNSRYPGSAERCLSRIYEAVVGFQRAGLGTTTSGPLCALLPGRGRLARSARSAGFRIEPIFQDHLPPNRRFESIDAAELIGIHDGLIAGSSLVEMLADPIFQECFPMVEPVAGHRSRHHALHRSGILVELFTDAGIFSHFRIEGRHPPSNGADFTSEDFAVRPARTWGEAWAAYSNGGEWRPSGLHISPDEICIAVNGRLRRFQIEDCRTLDNLDEITFGPGPSRLHDAQTWLMMADDYGAAGRRMLAWKCAEQAMLCSASDEERAGAKEAMEEHRAGRTEAARSTSYQVEPVSALSHRLGTRHGEDIRAISNAIARAGADQHDQRRSSVGPLLAWHFEGYAVPKYRYEPTMMEEALKAGMSAEVLRHLGYSAQGARPDMPLDDVFTVRLGPHVIWGNAETGCLVMLSDPLVVYVC